MSGAHRKARDDRTQMVQVPTFRDDGRVWRPFRFRGLERLSRSQVSLLNALTQVLPGVASPGQAHELVRARLEALFEHNAKVVVDYVHFATTRDLKRYIGEPTCLGVVVSQPRGARGLLELELALAHAMVDMLLGAGGDAEALRPLSELEESLVSYVMLDALKALAPATDPLLPGLRLEQMANRLDEVLPRVGDEAGLVVVQLRILVGSASGYLRLFLPATAIELSARATPRAASPAVLSRLSSVRAMVRAEIASAEISHVDLRELSEGDVVLVDRLSVRCDRSEGGTARLRVGFGRAGHFDAAISLVDGKYQATIQAFAAGEASNEHAGAEAEAEASESKNGDPVEGSAMKNEGEELLSDIPLQMTIELARVPMSAVEVTTLRVGQVLELSRGPGEPVELSVNGKIIARGEVVEVEGHLGVRVLSLAG